MSAKKKAKGDEGATVTEPSEDGDQIQSLLFRNGDKIPMLGLGTWKASEPGEVSKAVKEAIKVGYRHIDCAHVYGNEAEIGQAISEVISEGLVQRDQLFITSKLWNTMHAPEDVQPALENTLKNLQLEYLDLYLIHWPVLLKKGAERPFTAEHMIALDEIPLSKTWAAMEALVEKGTCKHIGVSNFSVKKIEEVCKDAKIVPEMNQVELQPYLQQNALLEACKERGILVTAYSPLGSLDRPAFMRREEDPILLEEKTVVDVSAKANASPAQILIAWHLHRSTAVIPKSSNPARIRQNFEAARVRLGAEDLASIAAVERNFRVLDGRVWWKEEGSPYTYENLWDEPQP